jgi:hypothetical protein
MVGAKGFEPSTSWSRTRRASQAALRPECRRNLVTSLRAIAAIRNRCRNPFTNWPDTSRGDPPPASLVAFPAATSSKKKSAGENFLSGGQVISRTS